MTKVIKLFGLNVTVIYEPREHSGTSGEMGHFNTKLCKIWIDSTMPIDAQNETLLHEIIEFIVGSCNMGLDHAAISTLSMILHQALEDNDLFKR